MLLQVFPAKKQLQTHTLFVKTEQHAEKDSPERRPRAAAVWKLNWDAEKPRSPALGLHFTSLVPTQTSYLRLRGHTPGVSHCLERLRCGQTHLLLLQQKLNRENAGLTTTNLFPLPSFWSVCSFPWEQTCVTQPSTGPFISPQPVKVQPAKQSCVLKTNIVLGEYF